MKKSALFFVLLFLACTPIFLGIFHPGFFLTDDGNWMVIRLSAFYEALRQGQFPVRFLPRLNNGFGYPVADFLYPLFLYVGSLIHALHISYVQTTKILFGGSVFLSGIGAFLWLRKKFGNIPGFVGGIAYMLFPYHLWDITKRGSLGEVLALGIVPFIFFSIDTGQVLLTAICIAFLVTSHNTLALLFIFVIFLYVLLEKKLRQNILPFILGLGISAFFWMPALFDTKYTVFSKTVVANFNQYFLSSDLYPLIGIVSFFVLLFSLSVVYKKVSTAAVFFLVVGFLSISLTNKVSQPLWEMMHLTKYVQFPFRFLSLTALSVGFLASYIISSQKKYTIIFTVIILVFLYVSSWQFFFSKSYQNYPDSFYSTNQDTTTVQNEYMPIWVKEQPKNHFIYSAYNVVHMGSTIDKGSYLSFSLQTARTTKITLGKVFFPGWTVTVDGKKQSIQTNTNGLIVFTFPKGQHIVKAWFGETPFRLFADSVSVISLVALGILFVLKKKGVVRV